MVTKKLNQIYGISFMWSFFILYWLPVMYRFLINFFHDIASPLILWKLIRYLWIIETDIVFWGQHYPVRPYTEDIDTHFGYQALIASITLSVIIAIIAAWIDKKYHKLSFLRTYGFNVLYVLIARITSLVMMLSGILKIYPDQFESSNSPGLLMSSVGSLKSIDIMWISNGSSQQYEIILGLIEFASGIFLWFSRTTILGGIIGSISMIFIELLDIFNSLPIYIFVSSILLGCLCILAPEIPYFLRYFIQGKIDQHYVPVFSFRKMTHSQCWKTIHYLLAVP